jgi:LuxR family maltose regulon positive regulatory protein
MPYLIAQGAAIQAHIALAQGNIRAAIHWADGCSLSINDDPSYLYEREYLTLARVRIEQGRVDSSGAFVEDALVLLERLLADAQSKARIHSVIEILVLKALALQEHGDLPVALNALKLALTLAQPEGYIRIFLYEGEPIVKLLSQVKKADSGQQEYAHALLAHSQHAKVARDLTPPTSSQDKARSMQSTLVDPLSERELEVLCLIAVGASNEEIAEQLVIAVGTTKRHVSNILAKLTVMNRTQAVSRARELGLL